VVEQGKARVARAVLLEGGAGPVCVPAVHLDDQGLIAPEEIHLVSVDLRIHLGTGNAVAAEGEHSLLELGAGAVVIECLLEG
jgi:hypothetical protein